MHIGSVLAAPGRLWSWAEDGECPTVLVSSKHTHHPGGPAATLTTAHTSWAYSTTSAINPSENNVMKTSGGVSGRKPAACELWGERTSLLPATYFLPVASIHAETFCPDAVSPFSLQMGSLWGLSQSLD